MHIYLLPKPTGAAAGGWLITLADLIALMLCFFVMMFAMSSVDTGRWDAVAEGMRNALPARDDTKAPAPDADTAAKPLPTEEGLDLGYLGALLSERIAQDGSLSTAVVTGRDGSLVVTLPGDLLFSGADAMLRPEGARAVRRLAGLLANVRNEIAVVGHATRSADQDGWAHGIAAGSAVARLLGEGGIRAGIRVLGMAAAPGRAEDAGRAATRVDILVREDGVR